MFDIQYYGVLLVCGQGVLASQRLFPSPEHLTMCRENKEPGKPHLLENSLFHHAAALPVSLGAALEGVCDLE